MDKPKNYGFKALPQTSEQRVKNRRLVLAVLATPANKLFPGTQKGSSNVRKGWNA